MRNLTKGSGRLHARPCSSDRKWRASWASLRTPWQGGPARGVCRARDARRSPPFFPQPRRAGSRPHVQRPPRSRHQAGRRITSPERCPSARVDRERCLAAAIPVSQTRKDRAAQANRAARQFRPYLRVGVSPWWRLRRAGGTGPSGLSGASATGSINADGRGRYGHGTTFLWRFFGLESH